MPLVLQGGSSFGYVVFSLCHLFLAPLARSSRSAPTRAASTSTSSRRPSPCGRLPGGWRRLHPERCRVPAHVSRRREAAAPRPPGVERYRPRAGRPRPRGPDVLRRSRWVWDATESSHPSSGKQPRVEPGNSQPLRLLICAAATPRRHPLLLPQPARSARRSARRPPAAGAPGLALQADVVRVERQSPSHGQEEISGAVAVLLALPDTQSTRGWRPRRRTS